MRWKINKVFIFFKFANALAISLLAFSIHHLSKSHRSLHFLRNEPRRMLHESSLSFSFFSFLLYLHCTVRRTCCIYYLFSWYIHICCIIYHSSAEQSTLAQLTSCLTASSVHQQIQCGLELKWAAYDTSENTVWTLPSAYLNLLYTGASTDRTKVMQSRRNHRCSFLFFFIRR